MRPRFPARSRRRPRSSSNLSWSGPNHASARWAGTFGLDLTGLSIVDAPHSHAAAAKAVELVRAGEADALMKGSLHTDELLAEVVKEGTGIRTELAHEPCLHHGRADLPEASFHHRCRGQYFSDARGQSRYRPQRDRFGACAGHQASKVAILSAVETVNSKIPSTIDAAALCKMADRGQIIGGFLEGPLALDNAISPDGRTD